MQRLLTPVTAVLLLLGSAVGQAGEESFKSGVFDPPRMAPDFELEGSNGSLLGLRAFRGKVVALYFGFTYCPRICPVSMANLSEVIKSLGSTAADVQVLFVTVDPDRDSPVRLREFLEFFHPSFLGATGNDKQLQAVRESFGVVAAKAIAENKKLGYEVHHSSSIYLIDREGKLRVLVPFGRAPEAILHDIKLLLKK